MTSVLCQDCLDRYYDDEFYSSCYDCFVERRDSHSSCIYCGRWHSPHYETCYQCRWTNKNREEAAKALKQYILWRDHDRCRGCNSRTNLHVDHLKPCRWGGDANPWNLQVLCRTCNLAKGDDWIPGGRWDRLRDELVNYYFLAGRGWLDAEQRAALYGEMRERGWPRRPRSHR